VSVIPARETKVGESSSEASLGKKVKPCLINTKNNSNVYDICLFSV
jgi:hypothetical protein